MYIEYRETAYGNDFTVGRYKVKIRTQENLTHSEFHDLDGIIIFFALH